MSRRYANAVAIADGKRGGEVRFLGEVDASYVKADTAHRSPRMVPNHGRPR